MKRIAVPLLAVAFMATACGHPLIPAAYLTPAAPPAHHTHAARETVPASLLAPVVVRKPILGVNLYSPSNYPASEVQTDGARNLHYIKDTLHANAVDIVWDFFSPRDSSDTIRATRNTLPASKVAILANLAKEDGLRVEFRPLIFGLSKKTTTWEGPILPKNPAKWFTSYYKANLPYLKVAQQFHIGQYVTATEMYNLNSSPLWGPYFKRVAKIYHGTVSYSSWAGDYFPPTRHLLPVHKVGMDMYEPLHLRASASAKKVTEAWEKFFRHVPTAIRERTTIQETGIEARVGAYHHPPNMNIPGRLDETVQANWYNAACQTVHRYHLAGVFFWKIDLADNTAFPAGLATFEGRKAAKVIEACAQLFN